MTPPAAQADVHQRRRAANAAAAAAVHACRCASKHAGSSLVSRVRTTSLQRRRRDPHIAGHWPAVGASGGSLHHPGRGASPEHPQSGGTPASEESDGVRRGMSSESLLARSEERPDGQGVGVD